MKPTYTFDEMITFLHNVETPADVELIGEVFKAEKARYTPFCSILLDHALNLALFIMTAQQKRNSKQ